MIASGDLLSFQDFAELSVVASLKLLGFPLRSIRHAAETIKAKLDVTRPFLEGVLVDDEAKDIFWNEYERAERERIWSATRDGQLIIPEAVSTRVIPPRVIIDPEAGVATRVLPYTRRTQPTDDPQLVALDPRVRFGRPITHPTLIDIEAIATRFTWGESLEDLRDEMQPSAGQLELEEGLRYYLLTLTEGQTRRLEATASNTPARFRDGMSIDLLAAENSTAPEVVQEELRDGLDRVLAA